MSGGTMYEQRDVVLLPFPYSDLTGAKLRPALIISNHTLNLGEDRICCLITSKETSDGISIQKRHFDEGSLPFHSWVKPHRIFTIHKDIIRKKLCTTSETFHQQVLDGINKHISVSRK